MDTHIIFRDPGMNCLGYGKYFVRFSHPNLHETYWFESIEGYDTKEEAVEGAFAFMEEIQYVEASREDHKLVKIRFGFYELVEGR